MAEERKKVTSISLSPDIHEIVKLTPGLNLSSLVEGFLREYFLGQSSDENHLRIRLRAVEDEIERLEGELSKLRAQRGSIIERLGKFETKKKDLEWRLNVLRKFKEENSASYEDALKLHARELDMKIEELDSLVRKR